MRIQTIRSVRRGRHAIGTLPASHLTKIKDLHGGADTQVSRGAMIPGVESERMRSQHRQKKLPPELGLAVIDNMSLGHGDTVGSLMKEPGPRMAVMVAVLTANKDYMGGVGRNNGLLLYHDGDFATSPTDRPIVCWIIADTP